MPNAYVSETTVEKLDEAEEEMKEVLEDTDFSNETRDKIIRLGIGLYMEHHLPELRRKVRAMEQMEREEKEEEQNTPSEGLQGLFPDG